MLKFSYKALCVAISLVCLSATASAQLNSNKTVVNSINNDNVTATVSFPTPVTGDLYVAVNVAGTLLFLNNAGGLSAKPTAFQSNSLFSAELTVLNMSAAGIPAGVYTLYQVVTVAGSDPLIFSNWIGGLNSLSQISFTINMSNTVPTTTPVVTNTATGKAKYKSLGCSQSSCHQTDPKLNANRILLGTSVSALKLAIQKNPGDMGYLADPKDGQFANDTDLQAIADYIKSL